MRQRLHVMSWVAGRSTRGEFRLTSFRALSSTAVTRYMRSRPSIATAWLPAAPSSQPMCLPKPLRLSHVQAAALPMGGLTAWQALFVHGQLARSRRVLVTGAWGGVGHIAVQLARQAGAAVVESGPVDLVARHSWRRGPRWRARGHDRRGDAGRDLLHRRTRPRATAGVENSSWTQASFARRSTRFFRSRRPGRRSSESRAAGSVARSCSRLALLVSLIFGEPFLNADPGECALAISSAASVSGQNVAFVGVGSARSRQSPPRWSQRRGSGDLRGKDPRSSSGRNRERGVWAASSSRASPGSD